MLKHFATHACTLFLYDSRIANELHHFMIQIKFNNVKFMPIFIFNHWILYQIFNNDDFINKIMNMIIYDRKYLSCTS